MAVNNLNNKLDNLLSTKKSSWKEKATWRSKNKDWLKYSRQIASLINKELKEQKITQKKLAELLNVSPQRINKIVKGKENLTLETINRIENALSIQLIGKVLTSEETQEFA